MNLFFSARRLKLLCVLALSLAASGTTHAITGCTLCNVISPPATQLGTLTDNLICAFTGTQITVSGDLQISVAAAPPTQAGTLASWTIECPLASSASNATTTTYLDGFVQFTPTAAAPPSTFQTTLGIVESTVEVNGVPVAGSESSIPLAVVNGTDMPQWSPPITVIGSPFNYTTPATLKQRFSLDGVYTGGPGGTWVVDVPVRTTLNNGAGPPPAPVPAITPWGLSALTTLIIGSGITLMRRRRRGRISGT